VLIDIKNINDNMNEKINRSFQCKNTCLSNEKQHQQKRASLTETLITDDDDDDDEDDQKTIKYKILKRLLN